MAKPALDLTALTPDEKLELIDDLWGSLKPEDFEITGNKRLNWIDDSIGSIGKVQLGTLGNLEAVRDSPRFQRRGRG